jgi:hypothetical protein
LPLPNGIPSHNTFGDVFGRLKPAQFESSFVRWLQALISASGGKVVAIDGNTLRRYASLEFRHRPQSFPEVLSFYARICRSAIRNHHSAKAASHVRRGLRCGIQPSNSYKELEADGSQSVPVDIAIKVLGAQSDTPGGKGSDGRA